jgi:PAS domain S-box-containing protein
MLTAPTPLNEPERLRALERLDVLDSAPEREFDALVATAALVCGVPISLVSLIDHDRQWFKANVGLPGVTETPRDVAFCAHAILGDGIFEVPDTHADPRFADNPLVATAPDIRFYAGATLRLSDGAHVGTLCVIDRVPRQLSEQQREALRQLSIAAVQALESRRMARAFAASETRFRTLSEASPLGVFATDAAGACTYTNARWQAIYGLSEAEALGDGWRHTLHPEDKTAVFAHWQHSAELQQEFDMAFRICRHDGTVRHVRSIARALLDGDGRVTGYVGSVEDITERLQSRQTLDEERERQAAILQGTGAGTWEWNVQTGETRFNDRWAEIVGVTLDELSPTTIQTWANLAHPDDVARSNALLQTHFMGETPYYECEARMRHRSGHWVWVLARGKVLTRSAEGQPEWMFGTHLDITVRKVQEGRLRKSEELLNRTGALAEVGGWELEIASGSIHWSEQTCRIHGLEPGHQPQLAEAINFYAPEARPIIEAAVAQSMAGGTNWDLELPLIQKGGGRIWVRSVGYAEFEGEKPVRLFGAFQNITQRVHDRLALEAAQQRVTLATEAGGIGVWELNVQTGVLTCDALMYSLYGLPEGLGTDVYELWARHLHPADRSRAELEFKSSLKSGADFRSEFRVIWSDGSVHFLCSAGSLTRDAAGQALRMVGVNWDVTPLRELANQLVEQHELLRVTLQSIGDAVITTDAHSQVTWLNPVAERMTGWLSGEALGRPLTQVFHIVNEETRLPTENPVANCLAQGRIVGLANHTVLISRNGDEFGIEDSAAPIRNLSGDVLGVVLVFHDVTEQRRLSGEMSYRATHDALTGLVNRAEFETRLRRTLDKAHEERS